MTDTLIPVTTSDGSYTLWSNKFQSHYHSIFGAHEESMHIFINAGLEYKLGESQNKNIRIVEYGLGTGLNLFLSFLQSVSMPDIQFNYMGIEAFPVPRDIYLSLNYFHLTKNTDYRNIFKKIHEAEWDCETLLSDNFRFQKLKMEFEEFQQKSSADIVYYDAFAPSIQAHLWEEDQIKKVWEVCRPGAVLTTYCAKGSFKRALKSMGFVIETLPGPGKKREITRAIKPY